MCATVSVVPVVLVKIGLATLVEGVAAFGGLVGHVPETGGLAGEHLLARPPVSGT